MDVLYRKSVELTAFDDEEAEEADFLPDQEAEANKNFVLERNPVDAVLPDLTSTYKSLIDTVRAVVKFFRHDRKI